MPKPLRLVAVAAVTVLGLAACGDDDESTPTTTSFEIGTPATIDPPTSAFPTVATIAPVTAETSDIPFTVPGTGDIPLPPVSVDVPILIDIVVGDETGPDRIESVPLGSTVLIAIVNEDDHDEYHIHGYDLGDGDEFDEGETATFSFTADMAGDFEVESHASDGVLFILRVQ
jgi:hypothetical protein